MSEDMSSTNGGSGRTSFQSLYRNLGELRFLLSNIYDAPVKLERLEDTDFLFRMSKFGNSTFSLCDSYTSGIASSFESDNDDIVIKTRSRGGYDIQTWNDTYQLSHDIGFVYTAGHAIGYATERATAISTIQIERATFEETLRRYAEEPPAKWSGIRGFSLGGGFGYLIQALSNRYRENFSSLVECNYSEMSLKLIQEAAIVAIADLISNGVSPTHGERVTISRRNVMRAVDMINNQTEPLTIHDLANALDISVRALQDGFRRHLNLSPHSLLKTGRIEGARRDLLSGNVATVREAATKWGFSNLARFNQEYFAAVGLYPKDTIRIGRGEHD